MTAPIKVDISSLLDAPGQGKPFGDSVKMAPLHRGDDEFSFEEPLRVDVAIQSLKRGVLLVEGNASAVLRLVCSRCLREFAKEVDVVLRETFCTPARAKEIEECYPVEGHEIDLAPAIEQVLLLALPMRILHSEDCKGLCPVCGVDLNEELGHSHPAPANLKFAVLEQLLKKKEREGGQTES